MWMGGLVPLGYDRVDKQLVVNEKESILVRHIYTRYLATGCVRDLKADLDADGYHSKPRPAHHQSPGGKPFSRGALYTILKNPAYVGKVHHQGKLHEGRHAAILEKELWEAVQERLTRNRLANRRRANARYPSLLAGLIYDDRGNRMSPSSSHKQNRRYTYYVSQAVIQFRETEAGKELVEGWSSLTLRDQIPIVQQLLKQVVVGRSEISVALNLDKLYRRLTGEHPPPPPKNKRRPVDLILQAPVILKRSGIETKLVYPGDPPPKAHKRTVRALQEALIKSMQWNEAILSGEVPSFEALIRRDKLNPRQTHRLRKLAFLALDIIVAIIAGQIPETLSLKALKRDFPSAWDAQRKHFGFP